MSSEGAGRDQQEDGVGRGSGRVDEGRSGQQSTIDDADALSLVLLLSASVLRVPDELPGLSLCSSKGSQRVGEVGRCSGYWFYGGKEQYKPTSGK